MPAPIVLRTLTPEVKKVDNPPSGQPVIATKAELRDGSRPGGGGSTPIPSNDGWQAILEQTFDVADSFDDTEDWNPQKTSYNLGSPERTNGEPSIWGRYSNDRYAYALSNANGPIPTSGPVNFSGGASATIYYALINDTVDGRDYICCDSMSGAPVSVGETVTSGSFTAEVSFIPKWIGNEHPVYRNRGKSLCINYNNFSGGIDGFGPSRLGTFFGTPGDSGSGYKKVHVFFMKYIDPAFYERNPDGTFKSTGVQKFFDICSGFVGDGDWGSSAEKSITVDTAQNYEEYGLNASIFNISGGGLSTPNTLFLTETTTKAQLTTDETAWKADWYIDGRILTDFSGSDEAYVQEPYLAGEWFGIEMMLDIGTLGNPDGAMELWIYDRVGNQTGHWAKSGDIRKEQFDHFYNSVTLGGNRLCSSYGACDPDGHSRFYVDDFVVHGSRIGPTYFQKLTEFEGPL